MDFLGILEDNDGSIWFGSGGGVHRYDGKTFTDFFVPIVIHNIFQLKY
ncbi:hypothetical protein SAMN04488128_102558 [Chitinophaga eiseniae]|uniref:Two component regulator propeller n=2 Tax=Chitinophaga eiseniae TaxID=634771 RepID=A0A1T4QS29_9BACT|nr:hypothetical protein SAMN04488128_102558 [Chitinophaga eiseniae]